MNKSLIVTIFVPTKEGKDGKAAGSIGTGYPVAEDLILTSRHVVNPEQGDRKYPIQVRWHYYADRDAPDKGWITLSSDDIVWEGEGESDAALLRCPRPEKAQGKGWGMIADKKPPFDKSWQSQGFPAATRYENVRNPDDVSGTTESMADQADYFVLNVTSQPEEVEMWKGASGMPVFVHDEILGVVRSVPGNFDGKKLYAVPTWKMLQDDAFREHIGLDRRKEYEKQLEKDINVLLCTPEGEAAVKALAKQLGIDWTSLGDTGKTVAHKLLNIWVESFVTVVDSAHRELLTGNDTSSVSILNEIVQKVLPFLFTPHCVEGVRRCKTDAAVSLVALPAYSRTVAEIVMAGVDRRAICYRPLSPDEDWSSLEGAASLPQLPEAGRDHSGQQSEQDFRTQLYETFEADATDEFLDVFNEFMRLRFVVGKDRERILKLQEEIIDQYIGMKLERDAEKNNLTYYFLINTSDEVNKNTAQQKAIARLKEKYPFVMFIELSNNPKHFLTEAKIYLCLPDLIT